MRRSRLAASAPVLALASAVALIVFVNPAGASSGAPKPPKPPRTTTTAPTTTTTPTSSAGFATGQLQSATVGASGCGTNSDGEPAIHVSRANNLVLGSERGLGNGSDAWRQLNTTAGPGASACSLTYTGQPNAIDNTGIGASGGDIDLAWGSALNSAGTYTVYVSSLNLGSVNVAHSTDNGATYTQVPVVAGLPIDDRDWIAAYGASTSLVTFHDPTGDISVVKSIDGGTTYVQTSQAIPLTDYKATNNELGNLVIDHRNASPVAGGFWAYQSFVAPSTNPGVFAADFNEAFVAVSNDGGSTWTDQPVPCSTSNTSLDHNFPNVSVDPAGNVWAAWSDDTNVFTAVSRDHGATWTCSPKVSTNTAQAIFPWLAATSNGVDLVYYGAPTTKNQTWSVYFAQDPTGSATGWGTPKSVVTVHTGSVCESGVTCNGGRQLFDDFGVDTDQSGWAHIAYSHDSPDLGGANTYTGYAVQTGGTQAGFPN